LQNKELYSIYWIPFLNKRAKKFRIIAQRHFRRCGFETLTMNELTNPRALDLAEEIIRRIILEAQEKSELAQTAFEQQEAIDALRGAEALAQLVMFAKIQQRLGWSDTWPES
jgi:hypothetical protein